MVGWSSGGTCALLTTVMHPDLIRSFVDIDGLLGPNAGSREQTLARLFGGDAAAMAAFDPATVMSAHGPYDGVAGWFAVAGAATTAYHAAGSMPPPAAAIRTTSTRRTPPRSRTTVLPREQHRHRVRGGAAGRWPRLRYRR